MKIIIESEVFVTAEDVHSEEGYDFGIELSRDSSGEEDVIKLEIPGVGITYLSFKEAKIMASTLLGLSTSVAPTNIEFITP